MVAEVWEHVKGLPKAEICQFCWTLLPKRKWCWRSNVAGYECEACHKELVRVWTWRAQQAAPRPMVVIRVTKPVPTRQPAVVMAKPKLDTWGFF